MTGTSFLEVRGTRLAVALFDGDFYYEMYPDVREAGISAFDHYMSVGWREGRQPNRTFDTNYYLSTYPDVARSGCNPLIHYVTIGVLEGRSTKCSVDAAFSKEILTALPVKRRSNTILPIDGKDAPLSFERLRAFVESVFESEARGCVISVSHDEYLVNTGGVQNVIGAEASALQAAGWIYIHLCPAFPQSMLSYAVGVDQTALVLTINGRRMGIAMLADLLRALSVPLISVPARLVIHHLMGSCIDALVELARACKAARAIVWLHDFFGLCVNPFLLRNNVVFCNAPNPRSNACMVCNSGEEREPHLRGMRRLFDALHPVVLAPSRVALDFWRAHIELPHVAAGVVPLATIEFDGEEVERRGARPLRVAHAGPALSQKGWNTFRKLLADHQNDSRYDFFRLGYGVLRTPGLTEVHVQVTSDNPAAMTEAIRANEIDVVINWSSCFETFSFVTLEAMAGGAFVVARRDAGNVWPEVKAMGVGRGMQVRTDIELRSLFISGEIMMRACHPRTFGQVHRTRGTADVLLGINKVADAG